MIGPAPAPDAKVGDVLVYLSQYGIFFAGDIAFHYIAPASQSAHIGKLIEGIDRINRMDVDLIVAPIMPEAREE